MSAAGTLNGSLSQSVSHAGPKIVFNKVNFKNQSKMARLAPLAPRLFRQVSWRHVVGRAKHSGLSDMGRV